MRATAFALTIGLASIVQPAAAQDMVDATNPEIIAELVRGFGSARLSVAGDNTPMIEGRIEGTAFSIFFYECDETDANCRSVSFSASWDIDGVSVEMVNAWNRDKRFGRTYVDDEGDPVLEMDVNLYSSVSAANFEDTIDWWRIVMADFKSNVIDIASTGSGATQPNDDAELIPGAERL
ncbi:YbjN domain-containing protein [Aureimonas mangrovi]|uniref:YbjN domain-containing protein n=1 Tax=Aureimonas mangrovi TaxID=2758041 RepID=UPI00163D758F|nr:YbjN domain-containing protein [Aureimonas mangrovi]